jgi:fructoselysine 6-phosphate deglycase
MNASLEVDSGVARALLGLGGRDIGHVFFVACGGSLSIMHPAKFMLDQHSATLTSDVLNAEEFVQRRPRRLGPDCLVVLCSMTGTTKETVRAAEVAKAAGALTVGLTAYPDSPLARACDHVVGYESSYTTGVPIDARDSNYARLYQLVLGLVKRFDGEDKLGLLMESLSHLQAAIDKADGTFAPLFEEFAPRFAQEPVIYTVASGADYGAAYSYAICVLMEMQWIDSQAIHANEFFHGPFEVVDPEHAFILLKGLDSTRPIEERAGAFLDRFGSKEKVLVLDAARLDLSGIAPEFQGNLVPLIFFDTLWRFAYKIAAIRGHAMLEGRRYMKKIKDY